jgi:conjugative relaxase-like TrwC/TraI family protein
MLSLKTQMNLKNAKEYFREHLSVGDYYAQGQQVRGEWFGIGAEKFGLKGDASEEPFIRLCEGLHPHSGSRLTLRRNSKRRENGKLVANRRVVFDFTISPPKSVSVIGLLQDARISTLHDKAIRTAMTELEKFAETRVRKGGESGSRLTGNVVGVTFRHETSRELDPHLHTHCVLFNATFDSTENCWKALEPGLMLRAQKFVETCYYHELCRGLKKLGYAIEPTARDFEIKNVPRSVNEKFSKRRRQIDTETKRKIQLGTIRGNVKDARERIARDSRKRKPDAVSSSRLRAGWHDELTVEERRALRELHRDQTTKAEQLSVRQLIDWADEHVFERRAVADDFELLSAAIKRGLGSNVDVAALRTEIESRNYVCEVGSSKLTSREVLRAELAVVMAAREGARSRLPLLHDYRPPASLAPEQARAVQQILSSRDAITLFRGGAGTGKSFALREVKRALVAGGRPVVVLAPQRQQVTDLSRDGLSAETVSRFITAGRLAAGTVVIVDEAGQVGTHQLRSVVELVTANRCRLILSGDTRQHGAVVGSDALRAIEAYSGVQAAEIETIRRQDPARARSAAERSQILRYRSAVKAAAAGDVAGSFGILDRLGWIRELDESKRRDTLASEYVRLTAKGETGLVVAQTWAEVRAVNEAIREQLRASGRLGDGKTVETFQAVDATTARKRDPAFYLPGQRVYFVQRYGRCLSGDCLEIAGTTPDGLTVLKNGRRSHVSFRYADRFCVVNSAPMELAAGDRVQLKFNGRSAEGHLFDNGELVTVRTVRTDGRIVVECGDGATKTLTAAQRLFNRGYAVTSYASQGKTVDAVIFSDAHNRAATNRNQWYVTISRGRKRVIVFTSDKSSLFADAQRLTDRPLALDITTESHVREAVVPAWVPRVRAHVATLQRIEFLNRARAQVHANAVRQHV